MSFTVEVSTVRLGIVVVSVAEGAISIEEQISFNVKTVLKFGYMRYLYGFPEKALHIAFPASRRSD